MDSLPEIRQKQQQGEHAQSVRPTSTAISAKALAAETAFDLYTIFISMVRTVFGFRTFASGSKTVRGEPVEPQFSAMNRPSTG
jgi:hypothetical protein